MARSPQVPPGVVIYLDESGTHRGASALAVAGYLSTSHRWAAFEHEWRTVLAREQLDYFHMTDFETRQGAYATWREPRRLAVIRQLAGIIGRHVLYGAAATIYMSEYEQLETEVRAALANPYAVCAFWCVRMFADWLDRQQVSDGVAYVLEDGADGVRRVLGAFERAGEEQRAAYRVSSVTVGDKKALPALQSADILAYETCKHILRFVGADSREPRKLTVRLLKGLPHDGHILRVPQLREMADNIRRLTSGGVVS